MNCFFILSISLAFNVNMILEALSPAQESKLHDLQHIHMIFNTRYALKEWKETHLHWDLDAEYAKAREKVIHNPEMTPVEFFQVVSTFVNSAQDYHVDCNFESTQCSSLPFSVKSANGRYFIQSFDIKRMDFNIFPLQEGDELLTIDGRPVDEVAQEIILNSGIGAIDTDQAFADNRVTHRSFFGEMKIPEGLVSLQFADKKTGTFKMYQMVWHSEPEYFTFHRSIDPKPQISWFNVKMTASDSRRALHGADGEKLMGYTQSHLPPLGEILWEYESSQFFQAYVFETEEGTPVGFLRIPHYRPKGNKKAILNELAEIITNFEASADVLIIDQTDNPGGHLDFMYDICSFFAHPPLKTPRYKLKITAQNIAKNRQMLQIISSIQTVKQAKAYLKPIRSSIASKRSLHTIQMFKQSCKFLIGEWEAGKDLTDPTHIIGVDYINPHPEIVYTKPIFILINELSMSCGDLFPAIMQDNQRALIIGNRSAGAGGRVDRHVFLSNNGIHSLTYTTSLAERSATQTPIENLGVIPNIHYKVSEYDLQNKYEGYKQMLLELLQKSNSSSGLLLPRS